MQHTASCPNDAWLTADTYGSKRLQRGSYNVDPDMHLAKQMLAWSNEIWKMRWRKEGKKKFKWRGKETEPEQTQNTSQHNAAVKVYKKREQNKTKY